MHSLVINNQCLSKEVVDVFIHSDIHTCFVVRNRLCFRTELLRRIKRYQVANHSCMVIKYEKDNRYDMDGVATHDR